MAIPTRIRFGTVRATGKNFTGWDNTDVNELLLQGRGTGDRVLRFGIYTRFQEIFADELPALPLYYPVYHYAIASRIKDVQLGAMIYPSDRLRTLDTWLSNTRRVLPSEATAEANARATSAH
jgi:peptide/nickel transport system substrate-binding protein